MIRLFCNGCDRRLADDEGLETQVSTATLPGVGQSATGLETNRVTSGFLCGLCANALHSFVGDPDEDLDASTDARDVVVGASTG